MLLVADDAMGSADEVAVLVADDGDFVVDGLSVDDEGDVGSVVRPDDSEVVGSARTVWVEKMLPLVSTSTC